MSFRKHGWADRETPDKTGPSVCKLQVESHCRDLAGALAQGAHGSPGTLSAPLRALGLKNAGGFPFLINSKGCRMFRAHTPVPKLFDEAGMKSCSPTSMYPHQSCSHLCAAR